MATDLAATAADDVDALIRATRHHASADPFPVMALDHVHFLVGNARQAAHYYSVAFGMTVEAYRGPETGHRRYAEYMLRSGRARFLLTGEVRAGTAVGRQLAAHGDGVCDLALEVPDVDRAVQHAAARGATVLAEPHDLADRHGTVRLAALAAYGDTRHTLIDRSRYSGVFLPGFVPAGPVFR